MVKIVIHVRFQKPNNYKHRVYRRLVMPAMCRKLFHIKIKKIDGREIKIFIFFSKYIPSLPVLEFAQDIHL